MKGPGLLDQIYKARKSWLLVALFFFFCRLGVGTFHLTRAAGLQALSRAEMLLQVHFHNPTVLHLLFAFTHKLVVVTKKKACLPNKWHFIFFSTGEYGWLLLVLWGLDMIEMKHLLRKKVWGDFFLLKISCLFFFSTKLETCDEIQLLKYNPGATWNYKSLLSIWGKSEFPLFKLGFYEEQTLEKPVICLGNKGHLFCLVR